jgi:tRNA G18 (ribose-2'-O)-methylase SpoU
MRLTNRQRQERMKEVASSTWQELETLPESLREQADILPRMPIEIITCPLGKAINHGGLLRIAEAFRCEMVTFSFEEDRFNDFSGHKGSIRWQPYQWLPPLEALEKAKGRQKVALTLTSTAVNFSDFDFQYPLTLVVGSELDGVPEDVLEQCDASVAIPMFGLMGSLNVATATAIVVQHVAALYAKKHRFEPLREQSKRLLVAKTTGDQ